MSRRLLKAAEAIREVVSMAILADLRDPRIQNVTVTFVEVSPDMREAKVRVSVMGDERMQNLCLHGLQNAAGFLQSKIAKRVETRYTPRLTFVLDLGIKHSIEVSRILKQVLPAEDTLQNAATADVPADEIDATAETPADEIDAIPPPETNAEDNCQPDH